MPIKALCDDILSPNLLLKNRFKYNSRIYNVRVVASESLSVAWRPVTDFLGSSPFQNACIYKWHYGKIVHPSVTYFNKKVGLSEIIRQTDGLMPASKAGLKLSTTSLSALVTVRGVQWDCKQHYEGVRARAREDFFYLIKGFK